jgi:hypothetical protein
MDLTPELSHIMTTIDRVRKESMKAVEKRCRKLCMGNIDFLPMIVALGQWVELFALIRCKKQGKRVGTRKIRRLARKVNVTRLLSVSLEEEELYSRHWMIMQLSNLTPPSTATNTSGSEGRHNATRGQSPGH